MWRTVAAVFMIWSSASRLKFTVITSTIGRIPRHGRADAGAGEARFRQRRIANPLGPELGDQALADGVAAAVAADILAHQEHAIVALDRVANGLLHRFAVGDLDRCGARGLLLHAIHRPAGAALSE